MVAAEPDHGAEDGVRPPVEEDEARDPAGENDEARARQRGQPPGHLDREFPSPITIEKLGEAQNEEGDIAGYQGDRCKDEHDDWNSVAPVFTDLRFNFAK